MKEKIRKEVLALMVVFSLIVLGVNGCEMPGGGGTTAATSGLDFSLVSGFDKISSGKIVNQGDVMRIQLHIENYDESSRNGQVCIRDDVDDSYGGIISQCLPFLIEGAEVTESSSGFLGTSSQVQPATTELFFPAGGEFIYEGLLLASQSSKVYVKLTYEQDTRIEIGVPVPDPETEILQLNQKPAPIEVSVEKSILRKEEGYKVNLGINLNKKQTATIFSPGFQDENYLSFKAEIPNKFLECEPSGNYEGDMFLKGLVDFENTKFIKCSTLIDTTEQTTWPLILSLKYGVEIEKSFPFTIKKEE